jgi:hypothetical protein
MTNVDVNFDGDGDVSVVVIARASSEARHPPKSIPSRFTRHVAADHVHVADHVS